MRFQFSIFTLFDSNYQQAEAEVVPSSSLVEVEAEAEVGIEVEVGVGVDRVWLQLFFMM